MPDWWIDPSLGNDGWVGDEQNPIQTHAEAWSRMSGGDWLWHYTGTYLGGFTVFHGCPSGLGSWATATQLIAIPGQSPLIHYEPLGSGVVWLNPAGRSYIIFDGFEISGETTTGGVFDGGRGGGYGIHPGAYEGTAGLSNHIRAIRCEIHHTEAAGSITSHNPDLEYILCHFHDNEGDGIYQNSKCLIESCRFIDIDQRAFQIHRTSGSSPVYTGAIARWNFIKNCGVSGTPQILLWDGGNNDGFLYGNIVIGTGRTHGVNMFGVDGWTLASNIFINHTTANLICPVSCVGTVLKNNISLGSPTNWSQTGTSSVDEDNLIAGFTPEQIFRNVAGEDFRLLPNSPARGAGQNLTSIFTKDYNGRTWPGVGAWDQGAIKYKASLQRLADRGPAYIFMGG